MVKVEIVEDKDAVGASPYSSPSSSRTSSSSSLSSIDSEASVDESLFDRIAALKDIVPPTTRHNISTRVLKTASFFKRASKVVGNVVWVVTTSALLVGLPLALALEDEAKIVQQEKEMLEQQQGAQQVRSSVHYTLFWSPTCSSSDDVSILVSPTWRVKPTKGTRSSGLLKLTYILDAYTYNLLSSLIDVAINRACIGALIHFILIDY
jgi:import receptor subunit TOM22